MLELERSSMTKRSFIVNAVWDDEAQVYYCESDIFGLHVEAETFDEFRAVVLDVAADLIAANHHLAAGYSARINQSNKP
jgi:hypothetical protein